MFWRPGQADQDSIQMIKGGARPVRVIRGDLARPGARFDKSAATSDHLLLALL